MVAQPPLSPFKQRLIDIARRERRFFAGHTETEPKYAARVGDYWKAVDLSLTGQDVDQAWSAAFVSWAMQRAGAGPNFPYSRRHGHYIRAAIQNALASKFDSSIVACRPSQRAPCAGDLIGQGRGKFTRITFEEAATVERYTSHVDIVVEVTNGMLASIGGNVGDSVTRRVVPLDADGRLSQPDGHWFVVIAVNL